MRSILDLAAGGQLGLVTSEQLEQIGLTAPQVRYRVTAGVFIRVRANVYRMAGTPISWEQAALAVVLSAGDGAVISHTTAAALWNLRHSDRDGAGLHLTSERQVRMKGVISHRSGLQQADRRFTSRVPVTSAERTILDWAAMPCQLSIQALGQVVDDAIRRRLITLQRLRESVDRVSGGYGPLSLAAIMKVLGERIPGYRPDDSDFETEMNREWDRLGLPPARRQYRVTVDGHNYRLDRAIVEYRIGIEWDSDRYHSLPSDKDHDSNRRARLTAAGWFIIPVTGRTTPELLARAVLRAWCDRGGQTEMAQRRPA